MEGLARDNAQKVESIRQGELDKCVVKMGEGVDKKQRKMIEDLSNEIVNNILQGPMTHLQSDGSAVCTLTDTVVNKYVLERMFDLSEVVKKCLSGSQG